MANTTQITFPMTSVSIGRSHTRLAGHRPPSSFDEAPASLVYRTPTPQPGSSSNYLPAVAVRSPGAAVTTLGTRDLVESRLGVGSRQAAKTPTALAASFQAQMATSPAGGDRVTRPPTNHHARVDLMQNVRRYVESELQILAESGNAALLQPNKQRLAVFRNGWAMVGSQLSSDVRTYIERVFAEYDCLLAEQERNMRDHSIEAERRRLEAQYAQSFTRLKEEHEAEVSRRMKELDAAEGNVAKRLKELEEQGKELQLENERMKKQHEEDHDRAATLSHAIIDARLAMLEAETAKGIAEKKLLRVQQADAAKLDLLDDVVAMYSLLRKNGIDYNLKSRYMFDVI